jgi:hypothetical protein
MPRVGEIARRYVEAMNAGDIEAMMALFAPGAVMRHPSGVYADAAAIRAFFVDIAFGNAARLRRVDLIERGEVAWLEVEAESDVTPGIQRVVDIFRLDDQGRIADLGVYSGNIVPGSAA